MTPSKIKYAIIGYIIGMVAAFSVENAINRIIQPGQTAYIIVGALCLMLMIIIWIFSSVKLYRRAAEKMRNMEPSMIVYVKPSIFEILFWINFFRK